MISHVDQTEISPEDSELIHSRTEIGNVFRCNRIFKEWMHNSEMPTNYVVTVLHATLFEGIESYQKKGMLPHKPGDYRTEDITTPEKPDNFYVRGLDVKFLMRDYGAMLDQIIADLPSAPNHHATEVIHNAAWAYYVLNRIHPFLDGNGRVSRFVLERVLKGAGFKDIIFSEEVSHGKKRFLENRSRHLDALDQVGKTGNLAYLEVYIAKLLLARYHPNDSVYQELKDVIESKKEASKSQGKKMTLSDIWIKFREVDILGAEEELAPGN